MTSVPSRGDRVDAAERVVGLAGDRLHLLQLGRVVERDHLVARRVVRSAVVDRVGDAGLLQRDRGVGHHGGAFGDAGEDGFARSVEVVDDVDAESVLLERDDGRRERLVVRQRGEALRCGVVIPPRLGHGSEGEAGAGTLASAGGQSSGPVATRCNVGARQMANASPHATTRRRATGPAQRARRARPVHRSGLRGREPGPGAAGRAGRGQDGAAGLPGRASGGLPCGARRRRPVGDGACLRRVASAAGADARSSRASTGAAARCAADRVRPQSRAGAGSLPRRLSRC